MKNISLCRLPAGTRWLVAAAVVAFALWSPPSARAAELLVFPTIHQVPGGPGELFANAYIIEGKSGTVVVDALLTRSGSRHLRQCVDALNKPLLAVIVTHGHPDHYGGITQLVEGRKEVPVVAINGVDAIIRRDDAMKGQRLKTFGIDWAETRTFPNVVVGGSVRLTFGDITLTPIDIGEAESHHDSVWILHTADGQHVFVGDLVMNGVHAYTADGHTGRWLAALRGLKTKFQTAARIYPGHGEPGGTDLLKMQANYLEKFRSEVRDLAGGRLSLSEEQAKELEKRMVKFLGHDKVARWILEGATPVAREVANTAQ
jgi:glyoxylase-like metal-dependent hydrolase (beta-lactamase superfamily II)